MCITLLQWSEDLNIQNLDKMPCGEGYRFLEVQKEPNGTYIACTWRSAIPINSKPRTLIKLF